MFVLRLLQDVPQQQLPDVELPGGFAIFLRAFFSVPQGVQMAGGILAALVALIVVIIVYRKRVVVLDWWHSRTRAIQLTLATVGIVVAAFAATGGAVSWNYMQHDNDFCTGCHVMGPAYKKFTESAHAELSCHDCHRQSIFASMRQLHLWIKDRPQEIGEHSKVPTEICAECHESDKPESDWPQIAATSGHLAHLESDSSALADVQCVTCHGQEVHQFLPADQTCGQAGCHETTTTQIVLGGMTEETDLHCVTCHEFTADPPVAAAIDSVTGLLTPGLRQCVSCHEMEDLWADYDATTDPHDGRCGACHNPHEQETPELALKSCTASGCHARPDTLTTLHVGLPDDAADDCTSCHVPHSWVQDGNDCAICHEDMAGQIAMAGDARWHSAVRGGSANVEGVAVSVHPAVFEPPRESPFVHPSPRVPGAGKMTGPVGAPISSPLPARARPTRQDAFSHDQHRGVECTACHSNRTRHGEVMVRTQSDCFSCHHSTTTASTLGCGSCHGESELGRVRDVTMRLQLSVWDQPRLRGLPFEHDAHSELRCIDCHGGGTTQQVQTTCAACHEDHHPADASTSCLSCHEEHREDAHTADVHTQGCTGSGCHTEPRFSRMERTRNFCETCHQSQVDHEAGELCVNCHLVPTNGASAGGS